MVFFENNDSFLSALNKMFQSKKAKGSVWITIKRYVPEEKKGKKKIESKENEEPKCLIRATDGYKKKISTLVSAQDVTTFQNSIRGTLLLNVDNLKKAPKEKKEKKAPAAKRANKV